MNDSCHVTSWTSAHWLCLILVLVTVSGRCKAMSDMCISALQQAETYYYNDTNHCKTTNDDQMLIQHGHGMLHKVHFLRTWLHEHSESPKSCPFSAVAMIAKNLTHLHSRMKRSACTTPDITCDANLPFRTIDGSCNNLLNPTWGMSDRPQNRLLPAVYEDGKSAPRSKGCEGRSLPSPRLISNIVHKAGEKMLFHKRFTGMVAQMGQFLAHDLVLTGIASQEDGESLKCCDEDAGHGECFPIPVPANDERFTEDCLNFARSVFAEDCKGVRQQLNLQTSALDVSQLYGANLAESNQLRDFGTVTYPGVCILGSVDPHAGKLLESPGQMLMFDEADMGCDVSPENILESKCFLSGDERTNEQPGLASMHTLFLREHNRVVDELAKINPSWNGEQLFQTARKIVGAEMQHIIYTEWLPAVLGKGGMANFGLQTDRRSCQFKDTYDPTVDLTIFNSFSTAVLRFGHAMLHNMIGKLSERYEDLGLEELNSHFFKTNYLHRDNKYSIEMILRWHCITPSPLSDRMLEKSVRDLLFPDENNKTLDLGSLNIQRGRDHAIPTYNKFREFCGLPTARHFGTGYLGLVDHDECEARLLEKVYNCPDDIDLFPGIMSEKKHCNDILGPTQKCLLGLQFKRLRDGDRFWYERGDPVTGFTLDQLNEIRKVTLSRIICDNTESLGITRNVFYQKTRSRLNHMMSCSDRRILSMDLNKWKD